MGREEGRFQDRENLEKNDKGKKRKLQRCINTQKMKVLNFEMQMHKTK